MEPCDSTCLWKETWTEALQRSPFIELETIFSLSQWQQFPNAGGLNDLLSKQFNEAEIGFICQADLDKKALETQQNDYYELVIAQQQLVPTRPNSWHDLFNGLVWLQFPQTKRLLNKWHVEDISNFGLTPRTIRRDNLTHLDECGVILAVRQQDQYLLDLLAEHQWHEALVANRNKWGKQIEPFVFGHANYEMLLQPFVGLTGKWLAITVEDNFFNLSLREKHTLLDQQMAKQLSQSNMMNRRRPLLPIPLLGIPSWHSENQNPEFYQNTDYFRPLNHTKHTRLVQETTS